MKTFAWSAYGAWVYVTWRIYQHSPIAAFWFAVSGIPIVLIAGNTHRVRNGR